MYAWIDSEKWDGAGQPALSEQHGMLVAPDVISSVSGRPEWYGKLLDPDDELVIARALLQARLEYTARYATEED